MCKNSLYHFCNLSINLKWFRFKSIVLKLPPFPNYFTTFCSYLSWGNYVNCMCMIQVLYTGLYISSQHWAYWCHVNLKLAMMEACIAQKLANAITQPFSLESWLLTICQHTSLIFKVPLSNIISLIAQERSDLQLSWRAVIIMVFLNKNGNIKFLCGPD